jgi:hypothetical protein
MTFDYDLIKDLAKKRFGDLVKWNYIKELLIG